MSKVMCSYNKAAKSDNNSGLIVTYNFNNDPEKGHFIKHPHAKIKI